ncbi:MAG: chemotaxis protein CheD [Syntrophales bacterium]|nr:chemotaxis protein CheD [Syntrophales bacterium]
MGDIIVGMGDMKISNKPEDVLVTYALGSCVAVVVYDPLMRVGGLLHYMLPDSTINAEKAKDSPAMFADTGIPMLFKSCYELGAEKRRMIVRIVGGASIINDDNLFQIGQKNINAARRIFWKNNVLIAAEDTGLNINRSVRLYISDGRCYIRSSNGKTKEI